MSGGPSVAGAPSDIDCRLYSGARYKEEVAGCAEPDVQCDRIDPKALVLLRPFGSLQPGCDPAHLATQAVKFRVVDLHYFQALLFYPSAAADSGLFLVRTTVLTPGVLAADVDENLVRTSSASPIRG